MSETIEFVISVTLCVAIAHATYNATGLPWRKWWTEIKAKMGK